MAWDTRCRNVDVRHALRRFSNAKILDAGCGEYGLAAFMPSADITGVDILPAENVDQRLKYKQGSILELPFEDRSFDVAVSIDVLEHLPGDVRGKAVSELLRVARKAVIVAFPDGADARAIDEDFGRELSASGQPFPDWLAEHLAHRYPETAHVVNLIEESGRRAKVSIVHSENLAVTRSLRWSAARSKYVYMAANTLAGVLLAVMPKATAGSAYRAIVVAEFLND